MQPILRKLLPIILLLILVLATAGCDTLVSDDTEGLQASGVVEAVEVEISPQMGGRVVEVLVSEGSRVEAGDVLARLDTIDLAHAVDQARAALATAEAELAQAQAGARPEDIAAAEGAVMVAQGNVAAAEGGLTQAETGTGFAVDAAEAELAQAQGRLASARAELARASAELARLQAGPRPEEVAMYQALVNQAQSDFLYYENLHFDQFIDKDIGGGPEERARYQRESARGARDAAQARLDLVKAGATEQEIAEARAGVSAAQAQVAIAEAGVTAAEVALAKAQADTPDITIAEAQVQIAEGQLVQAQAQQDRLEAGATAEELDILETRVAQAQANLETVNAQMEKLVLKTAVSGVVMTRNVQPGEVIQPGATAMTVGQPDELTITVYIPEDRYGQIELGDEATVMVDSFPNERFSAVVTRIADEAEFTPRNVQTEEERRATVFAVELSLTDAQGKLKPGMPADVNF